MCRSEVSQIEIADEIAKINKPVLYSGLELPLTSLTDRNFEILLYHIFKTKSEKEQNFYNNVCLMTGVGEKGRDVALLKDGQNVGLIQCKKIDKNISKPDVGKEIIKFCLHFLRDTSLITDIDNFTYFFAVSKGFSNTALEMLNNFNQQITKESDIDQWINQVIREYELLKHLKLDDIKDNLINVLQKIKIKSIIPSDISIWLTEYEYLKLIFFSVLPVTDNNLLYEMEKRITDFLKPIKDQLESARSHNINFESFPEYQKIDQDIGYNEQILKDLSNSDTRSIVLSKIKGLRELKDEFENKIISMGEQFKDMRISKNSRLLVAYEHFQNGDLKSADKILNLDQMSRDKNSLFNEKKRVDEMSINLSNEFLIKAQLVSIEFSNTHRFDDACKCFQESIDIYPNFINYFTYGLFLLNHKQDKQALPLFKFIKANYFNTIDEILKAPVLNNIGTLYHNMNNLEEAEENYMAALMIYQNLDEQYPEKFTFFVATALSNIANLQIVLNKLTDAKNNYYKAIDITNNMKTISKEDKSAMQALIRSNLAKLQLDLNELSESECNYQFSLNEYRSLIKNNPAFLPDLATTLNNIAVLQVRLNQIELALKNYKEALEIRRDLAEKNPEAFLSSVEQTLNNITNMQISVDEIQNAEINITEAFNIYTKLSESNSESYQLDLVRVLQSIYTIKSKMYKFSEAEKSCKDALNILLKINQSNPEAHLPLLSITYMNLANIQAEQRNIIEAEQNYNEALKIRRYLAEKSGDVDVPELADTLNNLAIFQDNIGKIEEAKLNYKEALKIRRELAKIYEEAYLPNLANVLNNLACLLANNLELDEAYQYLTEASDIYNKLAYKNPDLFNPDLAMIYNNLGNLKSQLKETADAGFYYSLAYGLYRKLYD